VRESPCGGPRGPHRRCAGRRAFYSVAPGSSLAGTSRCRRRGVRRGSGPVRQIRAGCSRSPPCGGLHALLARSLQLAGSTAFSETLRPRSSRATCSLAASIRHSRIGTFRRQRTGDESCPLDVSVRGCPLAKTSPAVPLARAHGLLAGLVLARVRSAARRLVTHTRETRASCDAHDRACTGTPPASRSHTPRSGLAAGTLRCPLARAPCDARAGPGDRPQLSPRASALLRLLNFSVSSSRSLAASSPLRPTCSSF
jgi:hypothetical protein